MRLLLLLSLLLVPLRTWTDSTGNHSVEAELVAFHNGAVYLKRNGIIKPIPIAKLSKADQTFVRQAFPYKTLTGKVVGIADGDTLTLLVDKQQHKIRLEGIDAPEAKQDFGTKAKQALSGYAFGKATTIEYLKSDRYGRILGQVFVDGQWINRQLVADGMAWHFIRYNKSPLLAAAELEAREAKRGLWADGNAIPPWDFRSPPNNPRPPPKGIITSALAPESKANDDPTVYIADTGSKYHTSGCRFVKKSKTAISLSQAVKSYEPCKVCKPPKPR